MVLGQKIRTMSTALHPIQQHQQRITWMALWCAENACALVLEGECGFGRECVGVSYEGIYPDYEWHDENTFERLDKNGEVWTPPPAYHKHPCVTVLGRGESAETYLYQWLRWFDDNGFKLTVEDNLDPIGDFISNFMLGKHKLVRMVKTETPST